MDPVTPPLAQHPIPPVNPPADPAVGSASGSTGTSGGTTFNIPPAVLEKYPALVELIKKTESMTDEEREYWFQILPIMTEEQVNRLKGILEEEAAQLAKLDDQYKDQMSKLNQKHLDEWNNFQRQQERVQVQEAEAKEEAAEAGKEDDILKQLDDSTPPPAPSV